MSPFQADLLDLIARHRDTDISSHRSLDLLIVALSLVDAFKLRHSSSTTETSEEEFLECARVAYRKARSKPTSSS